MTARVIVKMPGSGLWPKDVLEVVDCVRESAHGSSASVFLDELARAGFRLCEIRLRQRDETTTDHVRGIVRKGSR